MCLCEEVLGEYMYMRAGFLLPTGLRIRQAQRVFKITTHTQNCIIMHNHMPAVFLCPLSVAPVLLLCCCCAAAAACSCCFALNCPTVFYGVKCSEFLEASLWAHQKQPEQSRATLAYTYTHTPRASRSAAAGGLLAACFSKIVQA
jgi:hypothetical protein